MGEAELEQAFQQGFNEGRLPVEWTVRVSLEGVRLIEKTCTPEEVLAIVAEYIGTLSGPDILIEITSAAPPISPENENDWDIVDAEIVE